MFNCPRFRRCFTHLFYVPCRIWSLKLHISNCWNHFWSFSHHWFLFFKRSIDKIRRAKNVIKEAKIRHHNIDISRTNNKELFFHGSITFVSLFLYQNWWGWKADLWNRRWAWKEWKLKTKLNVECNLLWWLKPSFYPEPSQKASKKAHLCNHQQVDLVSTLRKLFEKGWRQIRLFDKSIKRHPNPPKVLG